MWFVCLLHSRKTPSDNGKKCTHRFNLILTLSSSSASSLTAGFTATGAPIKLSVGVLHCVSPAGDDGLLSKCKCDGTAVNGGSSGLPSTLATSSESTTGMKASQGMGWYKRQLSHHWDSVTFKILDPYSFSEVLTLMGRIHMRGDTFPYNIVFERSFKLNSKSTITIVNPSRTENMRNIMQILQAKK